jgi:phage terminase large subunit-like protein
VIAPHLAEHAAYLISNDPAFANLGDDASGYTEFRPRPDRPELFDQQSSFVLNKDPVSFFLKGNAAGGTTAAAHKTAKFLLSQPPPRHNTPFWVISDTYEQVCGTCWGEKLVGEGHLPPGDVDWDGIRWIDARAGHPRSVPLLPWPDRPGKNWVIEFKSYEQGRRSLQARSIGGFWFSEQFPLELFLEVLRACRNYMYPGGQFCEFTPIDPLLCMWVEKLQENPPRGWKFYRGNTECNRSNLAGDWYEQFFGVVPDEMRATRQTGALASFSGQIYPSWEEAVHVVEDSAILFPPGVSHHRAGDWGASEEHPMACFDDQTEVLTNEGWKLFADLNRTEKVATVSLDRHCLEFQSPTAWIVQQYDGDLIVSEPKREGVNFAVTPNHQMVIESKRTKRWSLRSAESLEELTGNNYAVPLTYRVEEVKRRKRYLRIPRPKGSKRLAPVELEAFCRFLGIFISEGCIRHGKRNEYIRVAQKWFVDEVEDILSATGWNWHKSRQTNGVFDFSLCSKTLSTYLCSLGMDVKSTFKRIPRQILNLPPQYLRALLQGLMLGDGSKGYTDHNGVFITSESYFTSSPGLASDVQELGARIGRPVFVSSKSGTGATGKPLVMFGCAFVRTMGAGFCKLPLERRSYSGCVYCVTVPNHTLVVRRGGKVMVCGNCVWGYKDGIGDWWIYDEYWCADQDKTAMDHAVEILARSIAWGWPWPEVFFTPQQQDPKHHDHDPLLVVIADRVANRVDELAPSGAQRRVDCMFGQTWFDPSRPGEIVTFGQYGIPVTPASNDVYAGIDLVRSHLKIVQATGQPRLHVAKRCVHLREEMRKYRWKMAKKALEKTLIPTAVAKPEPLKREDDTVDSLRYLITSESRQAGAVPTSMSHSEYQRRKSVQLRRGSTGRGWRGKTDH